MDWASRAVLAWRLSNSMDIAFCVSALEEALARFGQPQIFNTDQGSQFTGAAFTGVLTAAGIRISMDGRGRWMDNVFIERLRLQIPTKPAGHSNRKPATDSDLKPAGVPI
jgi:putative transposase